MAKPVLSGSSNLDSLLGRESNDTSINNNSPYKEILASKLHPFENHKFIVLSNKVEELRVSIKENGIITPLLVRPKQNKCGHYEIIAGHHRYTAGKLEGILKFPCIVRDVDNDVATVYVVETNRQRGLDDMLPSEIAQAIKDKYEAEKRQGKRTDLVRALEEEVSELSSLAGDEENRFEKRMERIYNSLNKLTPQLLHMVDTGEIGVTTGAQLSTLKATTQQTWLFQFLQENQKKLTKEKAIAIRQQCTMKGSSLPLSQEQFIDIVSTILNPPKEKKAVAYYRYEPAVTTAEMFAGLDKEDAQALITKALVFYQQNNKK